MVLFTPTGNLDDGIMSVSDNGGTPIKLNFPDASQGENSLRWPVFLPDGRHYLYLAANIRGESELNKLYIGSIDNKSEKHFLVKTMFNGGFADGYIFFVRDGTIQAQKLDLGSYSLTGDVVRIFDNIRTESRIYYAAFATGADVVLAQRAGEIALSRLTWYDRRGKSLSDSGPPDTYSNLSISPNGKYVAVDKTDTTNENTDVFVYDMARAAFRRLSFDPGIDAAPVWSPDGLIAFTSSRGHNFDIYVKPADGSLPEHLLQLPRDVDNLTFDWSHDGRYLLYVHMPDLWVYSFAERESRLFLKAPASVNDAQFSPDGKWVAYASNESGRWEVYVTSFPDARGKWQVSSNGGEQPRWRGDGKELYFLAPDAKLMAAAIDAKAEFDSGTPFLLFQTDPHERAATSEVIVYDVSRDGQRFLVNTKYNNGAAHPMSVVLNWKSDVK